MTMPPKTITLREIELVTKMKKFVGPITLTVYSDGAISFSVDDAEHFIYLYPDEVKKMKEFVSGKETKGLFEKRLDYLYQVYEGENPDADVEIYVEGLNDVEKVLDEAKVEFPIGSVESYPSWAYIKEVNLKFKFIKEWFEKWFGSVRGEE